MAAPLFQIPGNVKQQFLPFVLNPYSDLNKGAGVGSSGYFKGKDCAPQFFSYRDRYASYSSGNARLNFYPSCMEDLLINDDISYKLLYEYAEEPDKQPNGSVKISDIIKHIPGVQIREFLPDTRLDQCINFFTDLFSSMTNMVTKKDGSSKDQKNKDEQAGFFTKLIACAEFAIKYMTGISKNNFFTDMQLANNIDFQFSNYDPNIWEKPQAFGKPAHSPGFFVMTFPYTLYYKLQSCITSNVYEIPAATGSKRIMSSGGGMAGWTNGGSDFMSAGGLRISDALSKIPLVGNIANMILGNIGINYMPWWDANNGSKTQEPQVDITFDLFNDSYDAAMKNFIFVNTIVPNNKWIQYNMFQHSSCLYDVKIEGINRLFACAGSFNVTYEGILRDPHPEWVKDLVDWYGNKNVLKPQMIDSILKNKLIKIPDIYRVEMHFQSLLPANFNNFIFTYAENSNHMTKYAHNIYDPTLGAVFGQALGKFGQRISKVWEDGNANAADNMTIVESSYVDEKAKQDAEIND